MADLACREDEDSFGEDADAGVDNIVAVKRSLDSAESVVVSAAEKTSLMWTAFSHRIDTIKEV